jgi:hypothetical protein
MSTRTVQRDLYLAQRTLGDIDAAQRGRLAQRLFRRVLHRKAISLLRRIGAW